MRTITISIMLLFVSFSNSYSYIKDSLMLEMSDGIRLNTIIFLPEIQDDFPLPTILIRTIYGTDIFEQQDLISFLTTTVDTYRYIIVLQDFRGRHKSEGAETFFKTEKQDGAETIEWIASQEWSNGKVGMFGFSALATAQYFAAAANPTHLICGYPMFGAWNGYTDLIYPGGEFRKEIELWMQDNEVDSEVLDSVKTNSNYNQSWEYFNLHNQAPNINVPFLHSTGWYDAFLPSALNAYYDTQYNSGEGALGKQKLIIGPWSQTSGDNPQVGEIIFPNLSGNTLIPLSVEWFNYWLKGMTNNQISLLPDCYIYIMGPTDVEGYWNNFFPMYGWPFSDTDTLTFYPSYIDGKLDFDIPSSSNWDYEYDPLNPVHTVGGNNLSIDSGPYHQPDSVWIRPDVITFETIKYYEPFDIFGRPFVKLYASSDRFDTDFSAKLVDIYPDGKRMIITDGIIMARHRNSFETEDFITPNQIYEYTVDMNYTAYTIGVGHKLGLALSSSNYPRFEANPNTTEPVNYSNETLVANNKIYFGNDNPTALIIPIRKTGFSGIEDNTVSNNAYSLSVYPNPTNFSAVIDFSISKKLNITLTIVDILGNEIVRLIDNQLIDPGNNSIKLNCDKLDVGIYFCLLKNDNKCISTKISIVK